MDSYTQTLPSFLNANDSYSLTKRTKLYDDYKAYYDSIKNEIPDTTDTTIIDTTTAISAKKLNVRNQNISVFGNKISIPKFDKPVSYSLISPNGKVVLSGVANEAKVINVPAAMGVYILKLNAGTQTPIRQKIFLQLK